MTIKLIQIVLLSLLFLSPAAPSFAAKDYNIKNDTTSFFFVSGTSGNIGIATTVPIGKLEVYGGASAPSRIVNISGTFADLAGTRTGLYTDVTANVVGAGFAAGSWSEVRTTAASGTYTNGVAGVYAEALHSGASTATDFMGVYALANQTGSGPVTNAYGIYPQIWKGSGTITNAYGLYYQGVPPVNPETNVGVGVVTNQYALSIGHLTTGATRNVGIFLDDNTPGAVAAGNFGILQEASEVNSFAGNIGIGTTTVDAQFVMHSSGATLIDRHDNADMTGANAIETQYRVGESSGTRTTPSDVQRFRFFAGTGGFQEVVQMNVNTPTPAFGVMDIHTRGADGFVKRMTIDEHKAMFTGNVGLGTALPAAALAVGVGAPNAMPVAGGDDVYITGNLEVDGKIYGDGSALTGVVGAITGLTATRVPVASGPTTIVDSGIYYVGGNVGIGTASPLAQLSVTGYFVLGSYPVYSQTRRFKIYDDGVDGAARMSMIATSTNSLGPSLEFVYDGNINRRGLIRFDNFGSNNYGMSFFDTVAGSVTQSMVLNSGNIGIGTTAPRALLQVGNNPSIPSGSLPAAAIKGNLVVDGKIYGDGSGLTGINAISGLNTGYIPRAGSATTIVDSLIYQNANNIGIGTVNPAQQLQLSVPGSTGVNGIAFERRGGYGNSSLLLGYGQYGLHTSLSLSNDDANTRIVVGQDTWYADGSPGSIRFYTEAAHTVVSAERLRITSDGNVGIGTTVPLAQLQVGINPSIPSGSLPAEAIKGNLVVDGKIYGDGSGLAGVSGVITGLSAGYVPRASSSTTIVDSVIYQNGSNVGIGTTAPNNTIQVAGLVNFDNTDFNTKLGYQSGQNIVTGAAGNTFLGYRAGLSSAGSSTNAADDNTAVGNQALRENSSGGANSAYGARALLNNSTGDDNTALGLQALQANTSGGGSTAMGVNALYSKQTGGNNVALGMQAGRWIADGSTGLTIATNSVFLGAETKALADSSTNEIVIGYNAIGLGSNTAVLGNSSITRTALRGNIGVGTTVPLALLQVGIDPNVPSGSLPAEAIKGNLVVDGKIYGDGSGLTGVSGAISGLTATRVPVASSSTTIVDSGIYYVAGNVGIGSSNPSRLLDIQAENTQTVEVVSSLASGARTTSVFRITQPNNASYNSTGDLLTLTQSDTGSAPVFMRLVSSGSTASTGIVMSSFFGGTGIELAGIHDYGLRFSNHVNTSALYYAPSAAGTSGTGGNIVHIAPTFNHSSGGPQSFSGRLLYLARSETVNGGVSLGITGDVASFSSNCNLVSGTCTDTASILTLTQSYAAASGTVFKVANSGTGAMASFTGNGNIGIGTIQPVAKLHIGDAGTAPGMPITGNDAYIKGNLEVDGRIYGDGSGLTGISSSQWITAGSDIYYNTGNVGVGSAAPSAKLDIDGTIYAHGSIGIGTSAPMDRLDIANGNIIMSGPNNGELKSILWKTNDGSGLTGAFIRADPSFSSVDMEIGDFGNVRIYLDTNNNDTDRIFAIHRNVGTGTTNEIFRVQEDGNVGIGSSAPAFKLDLSGGNYRNQFRLVSNHVDGTGIMLESTDTGGRRFSIISTGTNDYPGAGALSFWDETNGSIPSSVRMVINATGNVGISTLTPVAKLHVGGGIPNAMSITGSDAYIRGNLEVDGRIYGDGSGLTGISGAIAGLTATRVPVASNPTTLVDSMIYSVGNNVGIGTTSPNNLIQVVELINFDNTDLNTKLGYQAGQNIISGAVNNTFVGYRAGLSGSGTSTNAADDNTAVGYQALQSGTSGNNNTAVGSGALSANASGNNNTAVGQTALRDNTANNNTAVGQSALQRNISGTQNVAVGFGTLFSNTDGSNNIALGLSAGRYLADGSTANTTADYGIFIGNSTKALSANDQNEIVVGYNATGLGSNTVVLGSDSILKTALRGNVGIGTTDPVAKLHVGDAGTAPGMPITGNDAYIKGNLEVDGRIYGDGSGLTGVSGAISGLTATRVPVASNSTTLVDSVIYSVGNNVGIGTMAPVGNLNVRNASARGQVTIDGANGGCLMMRDTNGTSWTECYTLNGTLTCSADADGVCDGS